MEKNRVRWGVLGCSGIGKNRTIPAMLSTSNAELYAIAGRNEEKLKAYAEPFAPKKLYTDYQALLNDENVDAVYVPLPNRHAQLAQRVKEIIDSGEIGRIRYLESKHSTFDTNREGIRYQKGAGGGAVYDVTCYNVSLASYLFGKDPAEIHVSCSFDEKTGVDLADAVLLRYENSGVASLYAGLDAYPRGCFSIIGDSGRIDVDHKFNSRGLCKIRVGKNARPQNAEYVDEITTEYTIWVDDNYYMEFEQFGNAILHGTPLTVTEEESLRTARICDAIQKIGGI